MENTYEEKIDYIYNTLKKQEKRYYRNIYYKWAFMLLMIGYSYYFIVISLPGYIDMYKQLSGVGIKNSVTENIGKIDKQELMNKIKSLYNK